MPEGATLPDLRLLTIRREVVAASMARHGDLLVRVGQLVSRGEALDKTTGQTLEHEIIPEEADKKQQATRPSKNCAPSKSRRSRSNAAPFPPGAQLALSYRERRQSLGLAASWRAPAKQIEAAPAPQKAPFDCVVENIEWEVPTTTTRKSEPPTHSAKITLVKILR